MVNPDVHWRRRCFSVKKTKQRLISQKTAVGLNMLRVLRSAMLRNRYVVRRMYLESRQEYWAAFVLSLKSMDERAQPHAPPTSCPHPCLYHTTGQGDVLGPAGQRAKKHRLLASDVQPQPKAGHRILSNAHPKQPAS